MNAVSPHALSNPESSPRPRGYTQQPTTRWTLEFTLRALLALAIGGAGMSELAGAEPVLRSLQVLGYPPYILPLLATLKLGAAVALVVPGRPLLKEWALAGIAFDVLGASYSFVAARQWLLPDVLLAPTYLVLTLVTLVVWRRSGGSTT